MKYLAAILLTIATLGGCQSSEPDQNGNSSISYGIVVDYSASTERERKPQMGVMLSDLELASAGSTVTVFRMGRKTDEVYSGVIDENTIDAVIAASMRDMGRSDRRPGTDFAAMTKTLNGWVGSHTGKRVRILVLTDGVNDFTDDKANRNTYTSEAAKLGKNPALDSLVFAGVDTGWREDVRQMFAPVGGRLRIIGKGEFVANR